MSPLLLPTSPDGTVVTVTVLLVPGTLNVPSGESCHNTWPLVASMAWVPVVFVGDERDVVHARAGTAGQIDAADVERLGQHLAVDVDRELPGEIARGDVERVEHGLVGIDRGIGAAGRNVVAIRGTAGPDCCGLGLRLGGLSVPVGLTAVTS